MRIGPVGSNPFIGFYKAGELFKNTEIARVLGRRDMNYLEKQAENARAQELSFEKTFEQAKIDISL